MPAQQFERVVELLGDPKRRIYMIGGRMSDAIVDGKEGSGEFDQLGNSTYRSSAAAKAAPAEARTTAAMPSRGRDTTPRKSWRW